jgi:hypothetical protein
MPASYPSLIMSCWPGLVHFETHAPWPHSIIVGRQAARHYILFCPSSSPDHTHRSSSCAPSPHRIVFDDYLAGSSSDQAQPFLDWIGIAVSQPQHKAQHRSLGSPHNHGPHRKEAGGRPAIAGRHAGLRLVWLQPVWRWWPPFAS